MKVLTATRETQGWRDNDFFCTVEGELVMFPPIECDCGSIDDGCGCHRAMVGLASHRATTTMKVVERGDLDLETYSVLIADSLHDQGYVTDELMQKREVRKWVRNITNELIDLAGRCPVGTVLERRGRVVALRTVMREDV